MHFNKVNLKKMCNHVFIGQKKSVTSDHGSASLGKSEGFDLQHATMKNKRAMPIVCFRYSNYTFLCQIKAHKKLMTSYIFPES